MGLMQIIPTHVTIWSFYLTNYPYPRLGKTHNLVLNTLLIPTEGTIITYHYIGDIFIHSIIFLFLIVSVWYQIMVLRHLNLSLTNFFLSSN